VNLKVKMRGRLARVAGVPNVADQVTAPDLPVNALDGGKVRVKVARSVFRKERCTLPA
jgi:hypothetical protein